MLFANKDQRLFSRLQVNSVVILATTRDRIQGICLNLSPEGILMEVECGLCKPGQQWQLVLPSAGERVPPLRAMARVLRVEQGVSRDQVALFLEEVH